MNKRLAIAFALVATTIIVGVLLYPTLPDRMALHWNAKGDVNGYLDKFWGVFLLPIISLVVLLLFLVVPRIDPLKANIEKFREQYDGFNVILSAFLSYLFALVIAWNSGVRFNMMQVLAPGLGALYYYCGMLFEKTERNWFVGIRTPWTLSSDGVWRKTHALGAKMFKACGIVALFGVVFPNIAIGLILIPIIVTAAYLVAYSYFEFRKEKGRLKR